MQIRSFLIGALLVTSACDDDEITSGEATLRIENVVPFQVLKSGVQDRNTSGAAGPIGPGQAFEITFTAGAGQSINFATMLGESNDWFFAPGPRGIALYDAGMQPRSGDITGELALWDAGTEIDQEPAVGNVTAPNQLQPNTGPADPQTGVRELGDLIALDSGATFQRPAVAAMIRATLTPGANRSFTLRIENVSTPTTLVTSQGPMAVHISPFAWALHIMPAPFFDPATPDRGAGLERIAEDGMPTALGTSLAAVSGFHTPLSSGVWIVHDSGTPLYALGERDFGQGLERIAEDGNPVPLRDYLAATGAVSGAFDRPVGEPAGPAMPGTMFEVRIAASAGARLSFATMYGMSNDWFFASQPEGIPLFDDDGSLRTGDVTGEVALYDLGTEVDQEIAIGPDTAPQQRAPNTGALDANRVVRAAAYPVPASTHLRVSIVE